MSILLDILHSNIAFPFKDCFGIFLFFLHVQKNIAASNATLSTHFKILSLWELTENLKTLTR